MPQRFLSLILLLSLCVSCGASSLLETSLEGTGSARSLGMGGKSSVVIGNVTDWLSNSAGLTNVYDRQLGFSYANLFSEEIGYTFLAGVWPLLARNCTFAAAYRQLKTEIDENLAYRETILSLGMGLQLKGLWSVGFTLNDLAVHSDFGGGGYGLDLGIIKSFEQFKLGLAIQNAFSTLAYTTGYEGSLERKYNLGIAFYPTYDTVINLEIDNFEFITVGLEYPLIDGLTLRLGKSDKGLAAGGGFNFGSLFLDYAMFYNGMEIEHRVSTIYQL